MNRNRLRIFGLLLLACGLSGAGQDAAEDKKLFQQAQDLAKKEQFDEAITAMKKAIALAPRNDLYLGTLSDIELKAGKYADGADHAEQAIKLNGKVGAYYVLAAANALGNQDVARAREHVYH